MKCRFYEILKKDSTHTYTRFQKDRSNGITKDFYVTCGSQPSLNCCLFCLDYLTFAQSSLSGFGWNCDFCTVCIVKGCLWSGHKEVIWEGGWHGKNGGWQGQTCGKARWMGWYKVWKMVLGPRQLGLEATVANCNGWGPNFVKMGTQFLVKWGPSPAEWGPKRRMFAKSKQAKSLK